MTSAPNTELRGLQESVKATKDAILLGEKVPANVLENLLEIGLLNIIQYHRKHELINNISHYFEKVMCLQGEYKAVGMKMIQIMWNALKASSKDLGQFIYIRKLVQKSVFGDNAVDLVISTFDNDDFESTAVKELDVVSQGRYEPFQTMIIPQGTVQYFQLTVEKLANGY